ncbi:MAG TPA: multiheme c-type cytochrome [Kiritimatiellia bacterium]|mgnify:CR=1 FL=1|nr:multiheme c-type cytochrome [Kiritimatiellia bacterium]
MRLGQIVLGVSLVGGLAGCKPQGTERVIGRELAARSRVPASEAMDCARCHPKEFEEWQASQHAFANRMVSPGIDRAILANGPPEARTAEAVIGITPLFQYLIPFPGGRLQALEWAYDPRSNEWFNVFNDENRQPGEWGHWTGRGNTWNVQCAFCHTTGFEKNYDPVKDVYASSWKAMGVSCTQCHRLKEEVSGVGFQVSGRTNTCPMIESFPPDTRHLTPSHPAPRHLDNCASCHTRREELFGTFKPGDRFEDHFRMILPDTPRIFHHDGQVLDEDFEYASFMMSRMGHQGVSCMDCHNPHSGKLKLPVENNALCMQCHTPPGANGATPIIPKDHMFHAEGMPGGRCVDCHMSEHVYMARDWRRDHGFTSPDPRLTIEHGVPNACNRCHTDQTPEWAEEWTTKWYGDKMELRRARHRARAVAGFHAGDPQILTNLLHMAQTEEIDAWRATLVAMLAEWNDQPPVRAFLEGELKHPHPRVRSSALLAVGSAPGGEALIESMRADASALVRVDAALLTIQPGRAPHAELLAYLRNISDQPAGALRNAQVALQEGRPADVLPWADKILAWDNSPDAAFTAGRLQHAAGALAPAVSNIAAAAQREPANADYSYTLALALAEGGNTARALEWLEETVRREPRFGRAWYNLGLAYAGADRLAESVAALRQAEPLLPGSPDPAFARATVHLRMNDPANARAAVISALQQDPTHAQSRALLRQLGSPR